MIDIRAIELADTYEESEEQIHATVRRFVRRHGTSGGSFEDLLADAQYWFMEAYGRWDPEGRRTWTQELHYWLWFGMIDDARARLRMNYGISNEPHAPPPGLADDYALGYDADYVVALVLDPPLDLGQAVQAKGGQSRNWRSSLRAYLRQQGWSSDRVNAAFKEIQEALP